MLRSCFSKPPWFVSGSIQRTTAVTPTRELVGKGGYGVAYKHAD
jgi:hypothetical protein